MQMPIPEVHCTLPVFSEARIIYYIFQNTIAETITSPDGTYFLLHSGHFEALHCIWHPLNLWTWEDPPRQTEAREYQFLVESPGMIIMLACSGIRVFYHNAQTGAGKNSEALLYIFPSQLRHTEMFQTYTFKYIWLTYIFLSNIRRKYIFLPRKYLYYLRKLI